MCDLYTIQTGFAAEKTMLDAVAKKLEGKAALSFDALGSLTAVVGKGEVKRVFMTSADAPSLVVTYIDKDGTVYADRIGDSSKMNNAVVTNGVINGVLREKDGKVTVDFGFQSSEEAEKQLMQGDILCFAPSALELGDGICAAFAGVKACVCAMVKAAATCAENTNAPAVAFVFAAEEEQRYRGAAPAAYALGNAEVVYVERAERDGLAVKLCDKSVVCDRKLSDELIGAAKKCRIDVKAVAEAEGISGASAAMGAGGGRAVGEILLPVSCPNTPTEKVKTTDADALAVWLTTLTQVR